MEGLNSQQNHALNVWLFSFYFAGMRLSDVLKIKWHQINDGRLHYTMNKNDKVLSIKISPKVEKILNQYRDEHEHKQRSEQDYVFPELKKANEKDIQDIFRKTKTANKKLNHYLKQVATMAQIDKKLTMHIARHTFGNISRDKIPIQMLQKLYRHSSITTTINYQQNFMHKEADEALSKVINFLIVLLNLIKQKQS